MSFLRKLFGPSKEEIWRQLCAEIGTDYVDGGFWKGSKVQGHHGEWTITLDTYATHHNNGKSSHTRHHTRMRAPFVNREGFHFTIYRKGFFSDIGKWFGMQDVEVGHPQFDEDFIIKGNDEQRLRQLFDNPKVRELIESQPSIYLTVKDDEGWFSTAFPEGVDELYFSVTGIIKDVDRLKALYELFAETLEQLCRIGSAYEHDPQVRL